MVQVLLWLAFLAGELPTADGAVEEVPHAVDAALGGAAAAAHSVTNVIEPLASAAGDLKSTLAPDGPSPFQNLHKPDKAFEERFLPIPAENGSRLLAFDPIQTPRLVFGIMLRPVLEANQLLPERLDPLPEGKSLGDVLNLSGASAKQEPFRPSDQRKYLGNPLSGRSDTPDDKANWHYQLQAGGSFRQGTSSNTNFNAMALAERHSIRSDLLLRAGAAYNQNGNEEVNRRFFGEALMDRNLRGRWIGYGKNEIERDQARRILLRNVFSAGVGYKFVNQLRQRWVVRTGPTASYLELESGGGPNEGFQNGWLVESDYRRALGDATRVEWTASAFPDFSDGERFRIRNEASLLFPIGGWKSRWNWKLGARQEYQMEPARGVQSSDVEGFFAITYVK